MILECQSPFLIPNILELAKGIDDVNQETLKELLIDCLQRKDAIILFSKKDEKLNSFLCATIEKLDGHDVVFIQSCFIKPGMNGTGNEILNRVRHWGKQQGVEYIYIMTKRNPHAFKRKYNFDFCYNMMKRKV